WDRVHSSVLLHELWRCDRYLPTEASFVPSDNCVPPNSHQIRKHAKTIPEQAHLAAFRMTPPNRRLFYRESVSHGQKKQLGIEAESECRLLFEDRQRPFALKEFEAALRIVQSQAEKQTDHQIENDSTELTQA